MEAHKRILGILFIVSGMFQIIGMIFLTALLSVILPLAFGHLDFKEQWVLVWIIPFVRFISVFVIVLFAIPSIIGGWGVLQEKKWAMTLVLVLGCFKLFSFPIGTALGIYTIWVYTEEHRRTTHA